MLDELHRMLGGIQQGGNFLPQIGIASALLVEKLGPRFRRQLECLIKQSFDLPPAI
jgi:hypothetical protein